MSQGPYWGPDKRTFPRLAAWLQNLATFKSAWPPIQFTLEFLGVRLNIPIGPEKYLFCRIHLFRWDAYNQAYIFCSAMAKGADAKEVAP